MKNLPRRAFLTAIPVLAGSFLSLKAWATQGTPDSKKNSFCARPGRRSTSAILATRRACYICWRNICPRWKYVCGPRTWVTAYGRCCLNASPKLEIFTSTDKEAVARVMRECDFLLHGSVPSLVARSDVKRWKEETGKPYGVCTALHY